MSALGLGFVTHHELEGLLGGAGRGGQQRRRLTRRGWLPEPEWTRADRDRLGVLPEFALAALVVSASPTGRQVEALRAAVAATRKLYRSRSFRRLQEVIRESLGTAPSKHIVELASRIVELDPDALAAWRADVAEAADGLAPLDLRLEVRAARIVDTQPTLYVVELLGPGRALERHAREDAPFGLSGGASVTLDRVYAGSAARDFLLPVPDLQKTGPLEDLLSKPAEDLGEDEELTELFAGFEGTPRAIPQLGAARAAAGERRASEPRTAVEIPAELLAGANTMSRRRGA